MMGRLAVFAYGSLVSRESIRATLGANVPAPVPARLAGWRRRWSLARDNARAEKGFEPLNGPPFDWCLGLNLEAAPDAGPDEAPNGALIELSEAAIGRLDLREARYDRMEVTGDVEGGDAFEAVFAYVAKTECFRPAPPSRAVVIASYLAAVETAFSQLGPGELELFRSTTGAPPAPVAEARLVRDAIPSGNPREW